VTLVSVADLQLEPLAFKVKVPTLEPTISIRFTNISTSAIASSVFSSSFKYGDNPPSRWSLKYCFQEYHLFFLTTNIILVGKSVNFSL
jgi:hypothetical protein